MAPASNEEQFKFLISCIRYSNNGKVDFGQVAKECNIVSKGAAAKRYERMMRAHGIAPNAASIKPGPARTTKIERRESATISTPSKKRKAEAFIDDNSTADDQEDGFDNSESANVKSEHGQVKEQLKVKDEHEQNQLSLDEAANLLQFYNTPSPYSGAKFADDDGYGGTEYDGSPAGYGISPERVYGMQSRAYDFSSPYAANAISSLPRSEVPSFHYQGMMQASSENQSRSDSPLIVE